MLKFCFTSVLFWWSFWGDLLWYVEFLLLWYVGFLVVRDFTSLVLAYIQKVVRAKILVARPISPHMHFTTHMVSKRALMLLECFSFSTKRLCGVLLHKSSVWCSAWDFHLQSKSEVQPSPFKKEYLCFLFYDITQTNTKIFTTIIYQNSQKFNNIFFS